MNDIPAFKINKQKKTKQQCFANKLLTEPSTFHFYNTNELYLKGSSVNRKHIISNSGKRWEDLRPLKAILVERKH